MNKFMKIAIKEAKDGVRLNHGGPFGAVIVRDGKIISKAYNTVLKTNDPTAHAEVNAIRLASKKLKRYDLSGCEIYATCMPCPMCLASAYLARISKIYHGCSDKDAEMLSFDDKKINDIFKGRRKGISLKQIDRKECLDVFSLFLKKKDKVIY